MAKKGIKVTFDEAGIVRAVEQRIAVKKVVFNSVVKDAGDKGTQSARRNAAVHTGYLRDNIYATEGTDAKGRYVGIHSRARYWVDVEFGANGTPPRPFMRPAFAAVKRYLRQQMK